MRRFLVLGAAAAALCFGAPTTRAASPALGAVAYTANQAAASVTPIDLAAGVASGNDVAVGDSPWGVALSPAGDVLYVSCFGTGPELRFLATSTRALLQTVALSDGEPRDVAATPDGAKVYVALHGTNKVSVVDVATHAETKTIAIPSFAGQTGVSGLAMTPDGAKLYVINQADSSYVAVSTTTDAATAGPFAAPTGALHGRVAPAGDKLMIVGASAPLIVSTTTDLALATNLLERGAQSDVAIAGTTAFVANSATAAQAAPLGGLGIPDGDAAIDVYELSSNTYLTSFSLGSGVLTTSIAASPDAKCGWVACLGDKGTVQPLDLVTLAESGPGIKTGFVPRTMAARFTPPAQIDLPTYFLPKLVKSRLKGAGKDFLQASGVFDTGAGTADFTRPVGVTIGGYRLSATLAPTKPGTLQFKDATTKLVVQPNVKGSSRGNWTLTVTKATLTGKVPAEGDVGLAFSASGVPTATARVHLAKGAFVLGRVRGTLIAPPFFPSSMKLNLNGKKAGTGSITLKAGFSAGGVVPTTIDHDLKLAVATQFFVLDLPPADFKPAGRGRFRFHAVVPQGTATLTIDFLRETVTVTATRLDRPNAPASPTEISFDPGAGPSVVPTRATVKLGGTTAKQAY